MRVGIIIIIITCLFVASFHTATVTVSLLTSARRSVGYATPARVLPCNQVWWTVRVGDIYWGHWIATGLSK